eukprot:2521556-Rhodomonas_salina.1
MRGLRLEAYLADSAHSEERREGAARSTTVSTSTVCTSTAFVPAPSRQYQHICIRSRLNPNPPRTLNPTPSTLYSQTWER